MRTEEKSKFPKPNDAAQILIKALILLFFDAAQAGLGQRATAFSQSGEHS
jgi:hypothetical protein